MRKRYALPLWTLLTLAIALLALHIALPWLLRDYLNDRLANMGDYRGQISDIDLLDKTLLCTWQETFAEPAAGEPVEDAQEAL